MTSISILDVIDYYIITYVLTPFLKYIDVLLLHKQSQRTK